MKLLLSLLLITTTLLNAQNKAITVVAAAQDQQLVFTCTNNTSSTQAVTLTLTKKKGLRGYSKPIIKKVAPKSTIVIASFTISGSYNYKYSTSWKKAQTEKEQKKEQAITATKKKEKLLKDLSKINTGIVVFDNSDCPRCQRATAYLLDNDIDFKILNIIGNKENNKLMWALLKAQGVTGTINTPVFLVEGQLSWSHENLPAFLESLR